MIIITLIAAILSFLIPIFILTSAKFVMTIIIMTYFGFFMAIINSAVIGHLSTINDRRVMSVFMLGTSFNSLIVLVI